MAPTSGDPADYSGLPSAGRGPEGQVCCVSLTEVNANIRVPITATPSHLTAGTSPSPLQFQLSKSPIVGNAGAPPQVRQQLLAQRRREPRVGREHD
jgi:hypothetical protein